MKKLNSLKYLSYGVKEKSGRSKGRITTPRRGTIVKRLYRFIDTKRTLKSEQGFRFLRKYVYDPNRTGYISIIVHPNCVMCYVLAGQYGKEQKKIYNLQAPIIIHDRGWSEKLENIPKGKMIYNVEIVPGKGGKLVRTGGNSAILLRKEKRFGDKAVVKMRSGEHRLINKECIACVGAVSNFSNFLRDKEKAGTRRLLGYRPRVRPSAMNPVDHPMGGRTKGGIQPCDRKRYPSRGRSTVKKKRSKYIFVTSRRARKERIS